MPQLQDCLVASAALLVLLLTFKSGEAIKCYECNSKLNITCTQGDTELLKPFEVDCSRKTDGQKFTLCRKTEQLIELEMNGMPPEIRVIRQCGWDNSSRIPCYFRTFYGGHQSSCACSDKDLCNSAEATHVTVAFAIALFSVFLLR